VTRYSAGRLPVRPAVKLAPLRIANKPEMSLIVDFSEGMDQTVNATGEATGTGVGVLAFKR